MDWSQVYAIIGTNLGTTLALFLWARSESKADWRHMDAQVSAIHSEMTDFHGRLCAIEERNKRKD